MMNYKPFLFSRSFTNINNDRKNYINPADQVINFDLYHHFLTTFCQLYVSIFQDIFWGLFHFLFNSDKKRAAFLV